MVYILRVVPEDTSGLRHPECRIGYVLLLRHQKLFIEIRQYCRFSLLFSDFEGIALIPIHAESIMSLSTDQLRKIHPTLCDEENRSSAVHPIP